MFLYHKAHYVYNWTVGEAYLIEIVTIIVRGEKRRGKKVRRIDTGEKKELIYERMDWGGSERKDADRQAKGYLNIRRNVM